MGYLILCVLSSSVILAVFKVATRWKLNIFRIILLNYVVATIPGLLFSLSDFPKVEHLERVLPWSALIGGLFIAMFFLVGKTTAVSGMAITSIASKMAVVIPVIFSIIYYNEGYGILKVAGMALAFTALFLSVYKKRTLSVKYWVWLFPLILFLGNGFLDSILKFTQAEILSGLPVYPFNTLVFFTALIIGIIISFFRPKTEYKKVGYQTWILGTILGLANFGSLYGMVMALQTMADSSLVFLLNNTGVVVTASLAGTLIFKEKLSMINYVGILLAILSIILLSLQMS